MRSYDYRKIDAFAAAGSTGNPAACIYLDGHHELTDDEMLTIARQHKGFVSEMVYCSAEGQDEYRLIYYSSECEVEFCGHGTIACMYDLVSRTPALMRKKEIRIETRKKGSLIVFNEIGNENAVYITAPEPVFLETGLNAAEAAAALGISSGSISGRYDIDLINAGLATLIVPVSNLKDEIGMFPDEKKLKDFCLANNIDIILAFSMETEDNGNIAHTRVFAPKFGYLEDPATGSGNSAFGYYMLRNGIWGGESVSVEQGGIDRVFNRVRLTARNGRVLFGGNAETRIIGKYYI
ncbi:MAG TPA: PhzF family phenazine biosynthesis isomerase [Clostridia bacterium]|nr:PhzF family phenazine biosynthesis isomerase [Clostridia bacterium]